MFCVIFNSAAPLMATRRGTAAQEEKRSPTRTTARNPNVRSFTVTIPAVARGKRLKGCTARIVPNYSAFRKRDRKRESQHHVSDCRISRSQSHCWLRLVAYTGGGTCGLLKGVDRALAKRTTKSLGENSAKNQGVSNETDLFITSIWAGKSCMQPLYHKRKNSHNCIGYNILASQGYV